MHDRVGALEHLSPILEAIAGVGLAQGWIGFQKAAIDTKHRATQSPASQARNRAVKLRSRNLTPRRQRSVRAKASGPSRGSWRVFLRFAQLVRRHCLPRLIDGSLGHRRHVVLVVPCEDLGGVKNAIAAEDPLRDHALAFLEQVR